MACWYGPPERYRSFDKFMAAPDAVLPPLLYSVGLLPTTCPGGWRHSPIRGHTEEGQQRRGGLPCRRGEDHFRQVTRVYIPATLEGKDQYHLRGWIRDFVVLGLGRFRLHNHRPTEWRGRIQRVQDQLREL